MATGYLSFSKLFYFVIITSLLESIRHVSTENTETTANVSPLDQTTEKLTQYHFKYYVRDNTSGDYKTQEESRDGETVRGSYSVLEPTGNLRVVTYTADIKSGFRADVKIHPGDSIMPKQVNKSDGHSHHFRSYHSDAQRLNRTFTPSKPRYVHPVTPNTGYSTNSPYMRGGAPIRYEQIGVHGNLKAMDLKSNFTGKKVENKQGHGRQRTVEKDSVVVEMHLNDRNDEEQVGRIEKMEKREETDATLKPIIVASETKSNKMVGKEINIESNATKSDEKKTADLKEIIPSGSQSAENVKKTTSESAVDTTKNETKNKSEVDEKKLKDKIKVEVEQIITSTLHQPTNQAHDEIKKEVVSLDKDMKTIQNVNMMNQADGRSNTHRSSNDETEELHISVHQSTRTDETTNKNRAQKKYSTFTRPLRIIEQIPVGNYQLQSVADPPTDLNTETNPRTSNNYYYEPTQISTQADGFYGGYQTLTPIAGNSIAKPQSLYENYPAENQQYTIGYEWIKMNPRMVSNNGESYFIMDPDYSNTKSLFGIPRPTHGIFHHLAQKNKIKQQKQEVKPDQTQAATAVKDQIVDKANMEMPTPQNQHSIDSFPKHDQQVPTFYKKDQEKLINNQATINQTQKYLEAIHTVPYPYPMEIVKMPLPMNNQVIKQLPVIQPTAINPISAYTWPSGHVAINPTIAFLLLPVQTSAEPQMQPIIIN